MKISPYDKLQGLINSRLYREDYRAYQKKRASLGEIDLVVGDPTLCGAQFMIGKNTYPLNHIRSLPEPARTLCSKWQIYAPFSPFLDESKQIEKWIGGKNMKRASWPLSWVSPPIQYLDPPSSWVESVSVTGSKKEICKYITHVNGKLVLMVDTSFPIDDLEKLFHKTVMAWKEKTEKHRIKRRELDKWEVYKMKENEKIPLKKIALKKNTHYEKVRLAYNDAVKIIKYLERQTIQK